MTTVLAILTYAAAMSVVAGIIPLMSAYVPGAYPPEIQSFACVVMVLFAICGQRSVTHVRSAGAFGPRIALNLDGEKSALQILQPATNRCLAA
ncbi:MULTISPECIES: hypothetical protein [Novosphingobium]|uniref:hypothetical protein n=1 Tax=Novosphingobium TaxID=165696 RepID=UPI0006D5A8E6|nr:MULTISPECIES: hypothetical protein [Novosphingobium]